MHNKESINQNALMHARHRRGERSFGGPRTGPLFPSKEVKTSNGRKSYFQTRVLTSILFSGTVGTAWIGNLATRLMVEVDVRTVG